mmetsp:Transcript_108226/g.306015  ORF Transcript_108226/g.306015 Transcript_108226/m.306015 type:complete len:278 (+) Transcript_108226:16-849(+)
MDGQGRCSQAGTTSAESETIEALKGLSNTEQPLPNSPVLPAAAARAPGSRGPRPLQGRRVPRVAPVLPPRGLGGPLAALPHPLGNELLHGGGAVVVVQPLPLGEVVVGLVPVSQLAARNATDAVGLPQVWVDVERSRTVLDGSTRPSHFQQKLSSLGEHQGSGPAARNHIAVPVQRGSGVAQFQGGRGLALPPREHGRLLLGRLALGVASVEQRLHFLGEAVEVLVFRVLIIVLLVLLHWLVLAPHRWWWVLVLGIWLAQSLSHLDLDVAGQVREAA